MIMCGFICSVESLCVLFLFLFEFNTLFVNCCIILQRLLGVVNSILLMPVSLLA